jgi:hypothetical protein
METLRALREAHQTARATIMEFGTIDPALEQAGIAPDEADVFAAEVADFLVEAFPDEPAPGGEECVRTRVGFLLGLLVGRAYERAKHHA